MKNKIAKQIYVKAAAAAEILKEPPPLLAGLLKFQPVFALGTGILFMLFLRRGLEYIPVIILFITGSLFIILYRVYQLRNRPDSIAHTASFLAEQFFINNILLFLLPFYVESTTFPSFNILFVPVLAGMTVLINWFSLYSKLILSRPAAGAVYYAAVSFSAINFILPVVIGLNNSLSLLVSSSAAAVLTIVFMVPFRPAIRGIKNISRVSAALVTGVAMIWIFKIIIPPAPLRLMSWSACTGVSQFAPVNPFTSIKASRSDEVYFLTNIFAPRGLKEHVEHSWLHNGRRLFSVDLKEISGGRQSGFTTWSKHRLMEGPGRYCIEVKTKAGQLIGRGCFTVYPLPAQSGDTGQMKIKGL